MQLRDSHGDAPITRRSIRLSGVRAFLPLVMLAAADVAAQATGNEAPPPATLRQATDAAAPVPPPAAVTRYARVDVEQQPVRCFDSDNSPVYLDQLARGDVVQLGEERNGFVAVTLPLGVTGYVHKKFATPPDDQGFVRTNGKRVSFRYRPRSTEAPADALDDGVPLHFMAEENEWYAVRNPRAQGFVPRAALSAEIDAGVALVEWSKLEEARRSQWQKITKDRLEALRRTEVLRGQRAELQEVVGRFRSEIGKPWAQQNRDAYSGLEGAVSKLASSFDAGSSDQLTATSLMQEIRKQVLVLDAQVVAAETLPPPNLEVTVAKATVEDPLSRFDLVGWVRVVSSSIPSRTVRLVRGGRVLGYLTCTNDRYDFSVFEGVEVGVLGPKEAAADGTWLLDVQRMDILGTQAR